MQEGQTKLTSIIFWSTQIPFIFHAHFSLLISLYFKPDQAPRTLDAKAYFNTEYYVTMYFGREQRLIHEEQN